MSTQSVVTFWGLVIFAKLCQMSGQTTGARVLIVLAIALVLVEVLRMLRR